MNCIFCKIMNNELPSYTLYEDDIVKVFLSIDPENNGHSLIVPKEHYVNFVDIPVDVLNHINNVSKNIYDLLYEKLNFDGLKFIQNNGCIQEVKHYHLHLIPEFNEEQELKTLDEVFEILK